MTEAINKTVAETIYAQLGGRVFSACTGAKNFQGSADSLTFSTPLKTKNKSNTIRVKLSGDDTYEVAFFYKRGVSLTYKGEYVGIYAEGLVALLERELGIYFHF